MFIQEIFESGASDFENRNASITSLRAYRKRKNHAADGSKIEEETLTYSFSSPKKRLFK